jgi:hypothetical protein
MDARTKEESARPLGVIGSLTAGFEMIGQRLSLIALPVLLDLLLWLGPRVSIASLVKQFAAFLLSRPAPDPTTVRQVAQMAQLMEQFGERSNLLALLSALPLLNVPSLLAQHAPGVVSPLGEPHVLSTTSVLAVMAWAVVLVPIGLVLGFLYLNSLARWVHAMRSPDKQTPVLSADEGPALSVDEGPVLSVDEGPVLSADEGPVLSADEGPALGADRRSLAERPELSKADGVKKAFRVSDGVGKFIRVFLFTAGLLASGMMLAPLWMLLVGTILATVPLLGMLAWSLSIGLGSYIVLHLLFVVPGVLVGGRGLLRAIWESILLIHTQFSSVVGLVLLVVVIYQGLGFVWSLPSGDSWLLLIGILGNGCIATGLTAALFVFYQERVGQLPGAPQVSAGS